MKFDKIHEFSLAQAITAAAASTNAYDNGIARDIGTGEDLWITTAVTTAFTDSSSDSTLTVSLQTSSDDSSYTTVQDLFTIAATAPLTTTQATLYKAKISPVATDARYFRIYYTPNNGNLSAGAVTTRLTSTAQNWKAKPKGYSISSSNQF